MTIVVLFLAAIGSNNAFAHSHLEGSNPADGEVITEALSEIVLDFDGEIEQGSFIDVTTADGQAVELQETAIVENTLTATVAEPFANGEYEVSWSIISADGHALEGEFSFAVDAPVSESTEEPSVTSEENDEVETSEQTTESQESGASDNDAEEESSSMTIIFVVLILVLAAGGVVYFSRRKK